MKFENEKLIFNFKFSIYFGRSGKAVGLSAISLLATLAKDAAPIPNAKATSIKQLTNIKIL